LLLVWVVDCTLDDVPERRLHGFDRLPMQLNRVGRIPTRGAYGIAECRENIVQPLYNRVRIGDSARGLLH
jgi:hypothetical protein